MAVYNMAPYNGYKEIMSSEESLDIKKEQVLCNKTSSLAARANKEDARVLYQISYLLEKKKQQKEKKKMGFSIISKDCEPQNCDSDLVSYSTSNSAHTSFSRDPVSINGEDYNAHRPEENHYVDDSPSLPREPPRNKSEERALKRIRRKIKNKLSAQESRRKKKEYLENLEKTVMSCTSENSILKEQVSSLNNTVRTLLKELQRMQETKPKSNKGTQTGTCLKCYLRKSAKTQTAKTDSNQPSV